MKMKNFQDAILPLWSPVKYDVEFCLESINSVFKNKVYYHLDQLDQAMYFALKAGELFDVSKHSEFVDTLVGRSKDEHCKVFAFRMYFFLTILLFYHHWN